MSTLATFLPTAAEFPSSNFPALLQDAQGRFYLAFDASTAEAAQWSFIAPAGLTGPLEAVVTYRAASATSGTFQCDVSLEAISDGDSTDTDAASSFATANTPSAATVPGTAGYIDQLTVALTNDDGIAAGDYCRLRLARNVADSAAGDIHVLAIELKDAA